MTASPAPRHQPYLTAGAMFQIGLRPFDPARWIDIGPDHAAFMAHKRARLAGNPAAHYKTTPGSRPAQEELRAAVAANLATHHSATFKPQGTGFIDLIDHSLHDFSAEATDPLAQVCDMVEEDFVLIENIDGRDVLTAASNAYSTSGRIVSAVGKNLSWAHALVPALNEQLGSRIDRVLSNVHAGTPVERFNWSLTPIGSRLFPATAHAGNGAAAQDIAPRLSTDPDLCGSLLFIRVERQTLMRLPETGALAFSIYTYSDPLASIAGQPDSIAAMHSLLASYSEDRLRYTEMMVFKPAVVRWLEARL